MVEDPKVRQQPRVASVVRKGLMDRTQIKTCGQKLCGRNLRQGSPYCTIYDSRYTVQQYRKRYAVSLHKQTTQIHTMYLQYLKIGTHPAHNAPQYSTSDAPKTQHLASKPYPVYGMVDTVECCILYCAEHNAHTILYTIQVHHTPYTIHDTQHIQQQDF